MVATEFVKRLQELIKVAGDVEVVVAIGESKFEKASIECQNVKLMAACGQYRTTVKTNTETVIKVW